jgi:regulator of sirC expression with transglutaminase-like and TPR domain
MNFQELIDQTDLDMTEAQVKAFFLGVLCAEKPMPFNKAMDELLVETETARKELSDELKKIWDYLSANTKAELGKMFPQESDITVFMEIAKDQLDFFLTAMSLSGTNTESCKNEELAELIDELEDTVEDMDEFLTDDQATAEDGEEFKEFLLGTWQEFVSTKK